MRCTCFLGFRFGLLVVFPADVSFSLSSVSVPDFQTLFVKCLPRSTVSRVWDVFFVMGTPFLFRVALALMDLLSPFLLRSPFEDCIQALTASTVSRTTWREISDGA